MIRVLASVALLLGTGAVAQVTPAPTRVADRAALVRLRGNTGLSLQWISWAPRARGTVRVLERSGVVHLSGRQAAPGAGTLTLDGDVLAIDARDFSFRGRIVITDAPDLGRACVRDGTYSFRATGTRRYWRLQQMEQCDGLTDYVDIYF
ncbi:hypothetical protein SAMN06297144_1817 [Sphingomonas guangdongensis]|uniref:Uncharacterized protein n=1 Tax=Sphingomonas guangdongensis TaxID=1141890 RepID=A0A285QZB3_9SPHN|nr:hypothetical protein [Sphingomonas guangdongensis]SOB86709.1 hypothetical protein SAMN06297144_1817 [Sphingomonas guangdongensis]